MTSGHTVNTLIHYTFRLCAFLLAGSVVAWKMAAWLNPAYKDPLQTNAWLAMAGLSSVLLWYAIVRPDAQKQRSKLMLTAVMGLLAIGALYSVHKDLAGNFLSGRTFRVWTSYHYYLGAKYFNELGYHDLYTQTLAADREGLHRLKNVQIIRNLRTLNKEPLENFNLERSARFSDERWEAFKNDVSFFTRLKSRQFYAELLCDRGYNPTPFWTLIGSTLTNLLDIRISWQRSILLCLDLILGVGTFVFCVRVFGTAPTAIVFLVFVLLPFNTSRLFGGFLTYDWYWAILLGLAFFHLKRMRLSAMCLAYAVMARVFPIFLVAGLAMPVLRGYITYGAVPDWFRRFAATFAICCAACLILGSFNAYGPRSWADFSSNIVQHSSHHLKGSRRVGLPHFFTHPLTRSREAGSQYGKQQIFHAQQVPLRLFQAVLIGGAVLIVFRKRGIDGMLWMLPVFFATVVSSRYYWSVLSCLVLLNIGDGKKRPDGAGSVLALGTVAGWYTYALFENDPYLRYVFANGFLIIGFLLLMVWDFARHRVHPDLATQRFIENHELSLSHQAGDWRFRFKRAGGLLLLFIGVVALAVVSIGPKIKSSNGRNPANPMKADFSGGSMSREAYPQWIKNFHDNLNWADRPGTKNLTREVLTASFDKGRLFMLNNQRTQGNFNYQYDFVNKEMADGDSQVRQAGALWGLSLMYRHEPTPATRGALEKGFRFFFGYTAPGVGDDSLMITYPGAYVCDTGTVALVALSVIEYLRTSNETGLEIEQPLKDELLHNLGGYLRHLQGMRLENGHFGSYCFIPVRLKYWQSSPYYDGETMLCFVKAARYLGYTELVPLIEDSAMRMAQDYTIEAWRENPDSDETKGFFQWSVMAFYEYQAAGWKDADVFGDYVLSLAWWMIHTHRTLQRTRNTAYAYEGLIHAYRLAERRGDAAALNELGYTIDRGLYKLTSWQVGGPLSSENPFLAYHTTDDPLAVGGVMNHRREPFLRIDVTQHQLHSVMLALKYAYKGSEN